MTSMKIEIPNNIKEILAEDWYIVNYKRKYPEVPSKLTVQHITKHYLAYKKLSKLSDNTLSSTSDDKYKETVDGIIEYFDVLLKGQLLYRFERLQYSKVFKEHANKPPSALFGSFHLLRLFVRLNSLLSSSLLSQESMQPMLERINDFLKFLDINRDVYL